MQFGIGFLKDENPEVIGETRREDGLAFGIAGEVVINGDDLPLAILAQLDSVDSHLIHVPR